MEFFYLCWLVGLEFNAGVNTIKFMSSRSVYLTTHFLDRLSSISSLPILVHFLSPETDNCPSEDCLVVLRFYGPVNPMGSCRARSVYLTTRLLGRLSPLSGSPVLCTFFRQKLTTALLESAEGRE